MSPLAPSLPLGAVSAAALVVLVATGIVALRAAVTAEAPLPA